MEATESRLVKFIKVPEDEGGEGSRGMPHPRGDHSRGEEQLQPQAPTQPPAPLKSPRPGGSRVRLVHNSVCSNKSSNMVQISCVSCGKEETLVLRQMSTQPLTDKHKYLQKLSRPKCQSTKFWGSFEDYNLVGPPIQDYPKEYKNT